MQIIGKMFAEIDVDQNGVLSRSEVASFLKSLQHTEHLQHEDDLATAIDQIFDL